MKKIPSLFKRDYEGTRQVYDEVVEGNQWVLDGEGTATLKLDGTSCMIQDGQLYKRYDRKRKRGKLRPAPAGWIPCEDAPNEHTGHWPGWLLVKQDDPADQWHVEAFDNLPVDERQDGTYELLGPKVQKNAYGFDGHVLTRHGTTILENIPLSFEGIKQYLVDNEIEGIVWHHPDGRMSKIKRRDFGLPWPVAEG